MNNRRSIGRNRIHRFGHRRGGCTISTGGFLGRSSTNTHGPGGAINAVHFSHGAVPFILIRKLNEAVTLGAGGVGVGDNFGAANGRVVSAKSFLEKVIGDVGGEIADEDGVFRGGIGPALTNAEGGPVEPEGLVSGGHLGAVVGLENPLGCGVGDELDEAVALGLARELVADDFDGYYFSRVAEAVAQVPFVHPVL